MNWIDTINSKAQYNILASLDMGFNVPEFLDLKKINPDKYDEISKDPSWLVLPNSHLAVKEVDGAEIMITAYWNGEKFNHFTGTINDNYLMTGEQGIQLESNIMTTFFIRHCFAAKNFKKITHKLGDYIGLVNVFLVIGEKTYCQAIKIGAFHDHLLCLRELKGVDDMENLFASGEYPSGFASSLRLWVYPYDPEMNIKIFNYIEPNGLVKGIESYLAVSHGNTIKDSWKEIYKKIKGYDRLGLCYRTDGGKKARITYNRLKKKRII